MGDTQMTARWYEQVRREKRAKDRALRKAMEAKLSGSARGVPRLGIEGGDRLGVSAHPDVRKAAAEAVGPSPATHANLIQLSPENNRS